MTSVHAYLAQQLATLAADHHLRSLPGFWAGVDFQSNDYLGFGRDAPPAEPVTGAATGSRLISGDREEYGEIEAAIARRHGAGAALVFNSGYAANTGLLSSLPWRGDTIIYDQLVHASIHDGMRLSRAEARVFRHNDLEDLTEQLRQAGDGRVYVVVESLYSMDGDTAPLAAIADLCDTYGAALIVDDAHAFGVYGPGGGGLVEAAGLADRVFARVITFGKALGQPGAVVLGSPDLRTFLINRARSFIYSTALPPAIWAGIRAAYLRLDREQPARAARLHRLIAYFQAAAAALNLPRRDGPIQVIPCPGNAAVVALEARLRAAGLGVKAIRHPTVARGEERLRVCLHAFNTEAEIDRLVNELLGSRGVE